MELLDWTDSLTIMKNERSWVRETHGRNQNPVLGTITIGSNLEPIGQTGTSE